jgi:simple sugar transport system permease protein
MDDALLLGGLLAAGIRLATPIALAAIGETLSQRAGVINVGVEGIMLVGAFVAVLFAVLAGNPWAGLLSAMTAGAMLGALHAFFTVRLKVEQIVSGIALLFLGLGLSGYGYRLSLGKDGVAVPVPGFTELNLPGLRDLPLVGPILFGQHALVYLAVLSAFAFTWLLARTRLGIMIRAAGDYPAALDAAGSSVDRIRFLCVTLGGAFAGAGGAFLSTAQLWGFAENMVAGRGFLAISCVVFARWNPLLAILVALGFGIADAAQIRLQSWFPGVSYQFFVIAPYTIAIVSLAIGSRVDRMPAALGVPFIGSDGYAGDRTTVRQTKTGWPVRFTLTEAARQSLDHYLRSSGRKPCQFLFPRRGARERLTARQYMRLVRHYLRSSGRKLGEFLFPRRGSGAHLTAGQHARLVRDYLRSSARKLDQCLFPGSRGLGVLPTIRAYARLVSEWVGGIGRQKR